MAYYSNECCEDDQDHEKCTDLLCSCVNHPNNQEEIDQPKEWDNQSKCTRCGGSDEQYGGTANMVDGKYGLCTNCADEMNA